MCLQGRPGERVDFIKENQNPAPARAALFSWKAQVKVWGVERRAASVSDSFCPGRERTDTENSVQPQCKNASFPSHPSVPLWTPVSSDRLHLLGSGRFCLGSGLSVWLSSQANKTNKECLELGEGTHGVFPFEREARPRWRVTAPARPGRRRYLQGPSHVHAYQQRLAAGEIHLDKAASNRR